MAFFERFETWIHGATKVAAVALVAGAGFSTAASALTIGFTRITDNGDFDAAAQLQVNVTDDGTRALFDFAVISNTPNPLANITEIYFSDLSPVFVSSLDSPDIVTQSAGVSFVGGSANPGDLPGRENASPPFTVTSGLLAEADGNNATGLSFNEDLVLGLTYAGGQNFNTFLTAFGNGNFRIGLHVRNVVEDDVEDKGSDSFVSVVPLPAAAWLLLAGLGGMGLVARRRKAAA